MWEYIRNWLCDVANLGEVSIELNMQWYTAWQEVAENSLYSMGGLVEHLPLSGSLGNFDGVRRTYLNIGEELKCRLSNDDNESSLDLVFSADATPKVYLIGKMLVELMKYAKESAGLKVTIVDMYDRKGYKTSQKTQNK